MDANAVVVFTVILAAILIFVIGVWWTYSNIENKKAEDATRLKTLCQDSDFYYENTVACDYLVFEKDLESGKCLEKDFYYDYYSTCERRNQRPAGIE